MDAPLPLVIEPSVMKTDGDCAIVCLRMLLGRPYAEVRAACRRTTGGLSTRQIQSVASRLGVRLAYTPGPPPDDAVGILDLDHDNGVGHYVIYVKDTVFDPSTGELWTDVEAYCAQEQYEIAGLLWRAT